MAASNTRIPNSTNDAIVFNNQTLFNVNTANVTKLTKDNYLMWSRQVHALFDGYELAGYLDGTTDVPPTTITTNDVTSANPSHAFWKRQDKLVYSALLGSVSTSVQPLLSRATTAAQIWEKLRSTYANPSRSHVRQLKDQLPLWIKGNKTIDEYVQGFVVKFDQLALLEKPIEHDDQVEYVINGLPEDYKPVVDQIAAKDKPPSLTEVHERLLNQEGKLLAKANTAASINLPATANVATQRNNNNRHYNKSSPKPHNNWQQQNYNNKQDTRAPKPYQGRCQICSVHGHSARRCPQLANVQQQVSPFTPWQPRANLATASPFSANPWLLDSGATHHMTNDLANLSLHQQYHGGDDVIIGDGSPLTISHTGSAFLPSQTRALHLNKVLCVPHIHKNLISVYRLCNANQVSVEFFPAHFQVKDLSSGAPLLQGRTKNELYEWPVSAPQATAFFASSNNKATLASWHSRLGHPSPPILSSVINTFSLPVSTSSSSTNLLCSHCHINKSHKLSFAENSIKSTKPLEFLFTDVWTSPITSVDNSKYYLIFVDHYTRYTWFYPMKHKSQVKEIFPVFKALVENRFQTRIVNLYSDNGGEYVVMRQYLQQCGISHLTTPPHTPEHNGISERKHRHIVETGLTLLSNASMPKEYWHYAFATAVYLINRLPTAVLANQSPFSKLFGSSPNYSKLRVYGCLCFPWLRPYTAHKLDDRSKACVFVGYSLTQSAYLCLEVDTGRVYVSRHVQFDEKQFPFHRLPPASATVDAPSLPLVTATEVPVITATTHNSFVPPALPPSSILPSTTPPDTPSHSSSTTAPSTSVSPRQPQVLPSNLTSNSFPSSSTQRPTGEAQITTNNQVTNERPTGPSHPSSSIQPTDQRPTGHNTSTTQTQVANQSSSSTTATTEPNQNQPENTHKMTTRSKNNIQKPTKKLSLVTKLRLAVAPEPSTYKQALKDERWRRSKSEEIDGQHANRTWDLVPPLPAQNVVGCRWVFKTKLLPSGALDKYKSRLVAKGFHQSYGLDYKETFSPVIKAVTIRIVLGHAESHRWPIRQLDVNQAFLQGTLNEEVYMSQPPGFVDADRPDHVCRLRKAIYGLKQAPRAWYLELRNFLVQIGFVNSLSDASLFVYCQGKFQLYVLVYVDDIIVTGNNQDAITSIISALGKRFSLKDQGDINYFLGIEVTRTSKGIHLMQRKYISDLLTKTNMLEAKPVSTPMQAYPKLTLNSGSALDDASEFRMIVGSLQYLAFTRPDISYAVNRLSQFMHRPTEEHWLAAKRILRYLAGTMTHGIFLSSSNTPSLHAFSNADWAGDSDDYVSTNAYVIYLGNQAVSWSSKKQNGVSRSSTESEYRAIANTAAEVRWICNLLTELHIPIPRAPVIYCDNVGATYLSAIPVFHSRMKHIALDYHFVRGQVQTGSLRVTHVSSKDQLADALTKPLPRGPFQIACSKIGVTKVPPS
ncbi:Reverse transcriptase RNA-dependent DNA polymerase [Arabidopsis suecica]|uniref:Reverse transcriptase RNA-dependent DNA polymerase n=1 Tax=Arabidopsis suecica TaxID=45249 RepID=A0A8T2AI60_ARASU|nr:Reverse transcriptase RNA-dependent DNA polymerase [Arabidopsis suecica]